MNLRGLRELDELRRELELDQVEVRYANPRPTRVLAGWRWHWARRADARELLLDSPARGRDCLRLPRSAPRTAPASGTKLTPVRDLPPDR